MIEILKSQPQTYQTLLKENFDNRNTITNLLRNKFSIWIRFHFVLMTALPGTRFGRKIFFHNDRKYIIVTTRVKNQFNYYYCSDIIEDGDYLILKDSYRLETQDWVKDGDIKILRGELIKWL